jgi:solute carrier family 25 (adenine nucleotide translocator) protein 4/5/6/31
MSLSNTTEKHYKIIHTLKTLIKTNGAKYFYKGFLNSLVGTAVFRGTFNGLYDTAKSKATSLETKAMIAYCCAVAAGGICYPLDSIRRRRIIMNSK